MVDWDPEILADLQNQANELWYLDHNRYNKYYLFIDERLSIQS